LYLKIYSQKRVKNLNFFEKNELKEKEKNFDIFYYFNKFKVWILKFSTEKKKEF
jgi:hypothetical protein